MRVIREELPPQLREELKQYVYDIIGAMHVLRLRSGTVRLL